MFWRGWLYPRRKRFGTTWIAVLSVVETTFVFSTVCGNPDEINSLQVE